MPCKETTAISTLFPKVIGFTLKIKNKNYPASKCSVKRKPQSPAFSLFEVQRVIPKNNFGIVIVQEREVWFVRKECGLKVVQLLYSC